MEATPEQVAMVKKAFDPLSVDAPGVGKVFFERLFELYPGSQKYFQHLGSTDEELFANPVFQHHCTKVILSVGTMIDNLHSNNRRKNKELFEKLATIHAKRKVSAQQTPYIKHTLMDILHLEPHSAMEKAWINVIDTLFTEYNEKIEAITGKSKDL
uniref:Leghemoglobin-1 n=1 Tax=Lygus hesperus TaxID=30085 RepID=A0A146L5T4_LYGHE